MDLMTVRHLCEQKLHDLGASRPFDLETFCVAVGRSRGRRIVLVAVTTGSDMPCGWWIEVDDVDYVLFEQDTSPLHREHIALHELGHMVFGHEGVAILTDESITRLIPDLDPAMIRRVLGRREYSQDDEMVAEMWASVVREWAGQPSDTGGHPDRNVAAQLSRVASVLEPPPR